jgi:transcriptional regulator with XRE-family HTH domain
VAAIERALDRARRRAREALIELGREIRDARLSAGLSQLSVAAAAGISQAQVSLIERGLPARVTLELLMTIAAAVGLDLSLRAYPGGAPLRDAAHEALLGRLRALASRLWRWQSEVPLPIMGDRRAWDRVMRLPDVSIGVEAETRPRDWQALQRRLALKRRDGGVDRVLLVLTNSRWNRALVRTHAADLAGDFSVPQRVALEAIAAGRDPGGNAVILI